MVRLHEELKSYYREGENGKFYLFHPLLDIPDCSSYTNEEINDLFVAKKRKYEKFRIKVDLMGYMMMLSRDIRPHILESFVGVGKTSRYTWNIEDKQYWEVLRYLWIDNDKENIAGNWYKLFSCNRKQKEYFMNESERIFLKNLPNEFTVYRSYLDHIDRSSKNNNKHSLTINPQFFGHMGFSYTLSKEVGEYYFKKHKKHEYKRENQIRKSTLFEGIVRKEEVFAYINENRKQEILIVKHGRYSI